MIASTFLPTSPPLELLSPAPPPPPHGNGSHSRLIISRVPPLPPIPSSHLRAAPAVTVVTCTLHRSCHLLQLSLPEESSRTTYVRYYYSFRLHRVPPANLVLFLHAAVPEPPAPRTAPRLPPETAPPPLPPWPSLCWVCKIGNSSACQIPLPGTDPGRHFHRFDRYNLYQVCNRDCGLPEVPATISAPIRV